MRTTKKDAEIEAKALHDIRVYSEEYFREHFPKDDYRKEQFNAADKLTGDFLSKKLKSVEAQGSDVDVDEIKVMVSCGNVTYPVLKLVVATWKIGRLFKKTMKGVFFVWHPEITNSSAAVTLSELKGFLNSNGLEDMATSVNWIGTAASGINIKAIREDYLNDLPYFGSGDIETCDVGYNLRSITFDKANMALVLKTERRD